MISGLLGAQRPGLVQGQRPPIAQNHSSQNRHKGIAAFWCCLAEIPGNIWLVTSSHVFSSPYCGQHSERTWFLGFKTKPSPELSRGIGYGLKRSRGAELIKVKLATIYPATSLLPPTWNVTPQQCQGLCGSSPPANSWLWLLLYFLATVCISSLLGYTLLILRDSVHCPLPRALPRFLD